MQVAFVQSALPPIIRAGALMVVIGGGLGGCGRMGDVVPVAANGQPVDGNTQKQVKARLSDRTTRYDVTRSTDARSALDAMSETLSPEMVD